MTETRKLKGITLEEDIDAVVRSLGDAGIVQFIDMRGKLENWNGVLVPYAVSTEAITKYSDLLSKIDAFIEKQKGESPKKELKGYTRLHTRNLLSLPNQDSVG